MKKQLFFLACAVAFFSSCKKDDLNININNAGTLKVKTVDTAGEVLPNTNFFVNNWGDELLNDSTDEKGTYNVGDLLEGTYNVGAIYEKDNLVYTDNIVTQVISNKGKEVVLDPLSNITEAKLTFTTEVYNEDKFEYEYVPISNTEVIVLTSKVDDKYWDLDSEDRTISWLKGMAKLTGKTNNDGVVTISGIPFQKDNGLLYYVFLYKTEGDVEYIEQYGFYVEEDADYNERNISFYNWYN